MRETLLPDVVPEVYQNECSAICMYMYVSSTDLHVLSIQEFSMVSRTSKTTELSKLAGGHLGGDGGLPGTIRYKHTSFSGHLRTAHCARGGTNE